MSYFKTFPVLPYPIYEGDSFYAVLLTDIALNVRIRKALLDAVDLYDEYDIMDGERPEVIAEKLYGDPNLHWIIMLFNEKYDYTTDFPMNEEELESFVEEKYGEGNRDAVHQLYGIDHYEDIDGNPVDPGTPLSVVVSNYEYEFRENESKRRIRVPARELVPQIIEELDYLMNQDAK